jgi:fatty-acyl-CoA synthase
VSGHEVVVIGSDGAALPDRHVGEIVIHGASVMSGYLPGTSGEVALRRDRSLLTGDLGYLAEGELYVVGRKKDLIIRAGRNSVPRVSRTRRFK